MVTALICALAPCVLKHVCVCVCVCVYVHVCMHVCESLYLREPNSAAVKLNPAWKEYHDAPIGVGVPEARPCQADLTSNSAMHLYLPPKARMKVLHHRAQPLYPFWCIFTPFLYKNEQRASQHLHETVSTESPLLTFLPSWHPTGRQ